MGYNPSYRWTNPTCSIFIWGYNPLTSRGMSHQVVSNSKRLKDSTTRRGMSWLNPYFGGLNPESEWFHYRSNRYFSWFNAVRSAFLAAEISIFCHFSLGNSPFFLVRSPFFPSRSAVVSEAQQWGQSLDSGRTAESWHRSGRLTPPGFRWDGEPTNGISLVCINESGISILGYLMVYITNNRIVVI